MENKMKLIAYILAVAFFILSARYTVAAEQTISISKVESATVLSVRKLSEADLLRDQSRGWALFGRALIGGVLGYQHGGGSAFDVKMVLDSVLRHNHSMSISNELESEIKIHLFEMQVSLSDGARKTIVLSNKNNTVYRAEDKIRLVHFETGVFIDKIL